MLNRHGACVWHRFVPYAFEVRNVCHKHVRSGLPLDGHKLRHAREERTRRRREPAAGREGTDVFELFVRVHAHRDVFLRRETLLERTEESEVGRTLVLVVGLQACITLSEST